MSAALFDDCKIIINVENVSDHIILWIENRRQKSMKTVKINLNKSFSFINQIIVLSNINFNVFT